MNRRIKLAYIVHAYPKVTETFTYDEVFGLNQQGLDTQVYCFKKPVILNLTAGMKEAMERTIYFPTLLNHKFIFAQIYFLFLQPLKYLGLFVIVSFARRQQYTPPRLIFHNFIDFLRGIYLAFILKGRCDFIYLHAQFIDNAATAAYICKKLIGIRYSLGSHTSFNPALTYRKIKEAEFVISCSSFDKAQLLSRSSQEFHKKIHVSYLGVSICARPMNIDESEGLILSIGTLSEKKGHKFLIQACRILMSLGIKFHCVIIGDGPEKINLESDIEKMNLSGFVEIVGYRSHVFIEEVLSKCSIFVLSCVVAKHNDIDGIPVVLMEAMAFGKPCISTPISGIPELIDNDINGLLIPPGDSAALADKLKLLLENKQFRDNLGNAAVQKQIKDFDIDKNIRKKADIFLRYIEKDKT